VEDDEEREAAHPRRVRLPLVPVQRLGERLRRGFGLRPPVEAGAVGLPGLPADALLAVAPLARWEEMAVERDEVERRPDPDDRRDDLHPADEQGNPVDGGGAGRGSPPRSRALSTSAPGAVRSSSSRSRSRRARRMSRISLFGRRLTNTTKRKPN